MGEHQDMSQTDGTCNIILQNKFQKTEMMKNNTKQNEKQQQQQQQQKTLDSRVIQERED
jgi:hypothetical protein